MDKNHVVSYQSYQKYNSTYRAHFLSFCLDLLRVTFDNWKVNDPNTGLV